MELLGTLGPGWCRHCHLPRLSLLLPVSHCPDLLQKHVADREQYSCLSRRRKRRGVKPVYGTGWMASGVGNNKFGHNNNQQHQMNNYGNQGGYNYGQQGGYNNGASPPAYGPPQPQGYYGNSNEGYYGQGQYSGVQAPEGTYQRDNPYGAPPGPPPGK